MYLDREGAVLEANRAALKRGSLQLQDVRGLPFWQVPWWGHDPEQRKGLKNAVSRAASGSIVRYKVEVADGPDSIPFDLSIKPIEGDLGAVTSLLVEARDVTNQQRTEEALRLKSEELELIINNVPFGIIFKDDQNNLIRLNRVSARFLGVSVQEAEGKSAYELYPDAAEQGYQDDLEVIRSGKPKLGLVRRFDMPGEGPVWHRYDKIPYRDPKTGKDFVFICSHDITAERRADKARLATEEWYRRLFERTPIMLHTNSPDGRIIDVNDYWLERLGYARDEVVGKLSREFLTPESAKSVAEFVLPEFLKTGSYRDGEFQYVTKTGELLDGLVSAVADYDENGEIVHAIVMTVDITERKAVERQLVQAQKMETLGLLTGGMAHDFNNLLSVVLGNLQLLEPRVQDDAEALKRASAAMRAVDRGAKLTRRLLSFSRRQNLATSLVDTNPLIQNMASMLDSLLGEAVTLECRLGESVPPIWSDAAQLESALVNLAINARDAMAAGGIVTIESSTETFDGSAPGRLAELAPGDYVVIAVNDTGTGIPDDRIDKVFEPFYTTKEEGKGTGLGLSMIYGFLKQSGGHAEISSVVGEGTKVTLYLPVGSGHATEPEIVKQAVQNFAGNAGITILAVEDQKDVGEMASALLESLGFSVILEKRGQDALDELRRNPEIDVLFTDIVMPGQLNGVELAERALELRPALPILFTTGFADIRSLSEGTIDVNKNLIVKPYRKSDLAAAILGVLDSATRAKLELQIRETRQADEAH